AGGQRDSDAESQAPGSEYQLHFVRPLRQRNADKGIIRTKYRRFFAVYERSPAWIEDLTDDQEAGPLVHNPVCRFVNSARDNGNRVAARVWRRFHFWGHHAQNGGPCRIEFGIFQARQLILLAGYDLDRAGYCGDESRALKDMQILKHPDGSITECQFETVRPRIEEAVTRVLCCRDQITEIHEIDSAVVETGELKRVELRTGRRLAQAPQ